MPLNIDGPSMEQLSNAIESAIPNMMTFGNVITFKLDDSIFNYAGMGSPFPHIRAEFIKSYNARHKIDELTVALLEYNPTNEELLRFAWDHNIIKRPGVGGEDPVPGDNALETMTDPERGFGTPGAFMRKFGEVVARTCRISVKGDANTNFGTGFLIGNDLVLTNFHVIKGAKEGTGGKNHGSVKILFDYMTDPDNEVITKGSEYSVIDDPDKWLVDFSPYDPADVKRREKDDDVKIARDSAKLDYAVLRLSEDVGSKEIGTNLVGDGAKRGFVDISNIPADRADDFVGNGDGAFIFQHPYSADAGTSLPMQMDFEKPAALGLSNDKNRVYYNINTLGGSSGSLVVNMKFQPVALHHAGGRDWPAEDGFLYNRGIPIHLVAEQLKAKELV